MTAFLDAPHERVAKIVTGAHGVGRTVTAATFLSRQYSIPLDAPDFPLEDYQRRFEVRWQGMDYPMGQPNAHSGENADALSCVLLVGYRYDLDTPPTGAGTAAGDSCLADAQKRALSDAKVIERALVWPDNWPGTSPAIFNIQRNGLVTADEINGDRVLLRMPLLVEVSYDPATGWTL